RRRGARPAFPRGPPGRGGALHLWRRRRPAEPAGRGAGSAREALLDGRVARARTRGPGRAAGERSGAGLTLAAARRVFWSRVFAGASHPVRLDWSGAAGVVGCVFLAGTPPSN